MNGKPFNGMVCSVMDDKGRKIGVPFKSSLFGKDINMNALQKRCALSKEMILNKQITERMKPLIAQAMLEAKSKDNLMGLLKEKGIGVVFRQNEQNRIYGVTFVDFESKTALNGSRLGKEFSTNVFEEKFNKLSTNNLSKEAVNSVLVGFYLIDFHVDTNIENNDGLVSVASLFAFEQHGTDYQAENFAKQKEAEVKRKQRRRG